MLTITIPEMELFDEEKQEFINIKETEITLEHSLVSISKWESKWHKPFLSREPKSKEEETDYIKCMTITQNIDPLIYDYLTADIYAKINSYINDPMTASLIPEEKTTKKNHEKVTSELIYYWMISLQVPFECQKWHLNRLLMLIKVCNFKNTPGKKLSKNEIYSRNKMLNDARRKAMHSRG